MFEEMGGRQTPRSRRHPFHRDSATLQHPALSSLRLVFLHPWPLTEPPSLGVGGVTVVDSHTWWQAFTL